MDSYVILKEKIKRLENQIVFLQKEKNVVVMPIYEFIESYEEYLSNISPNSINSSSSKILEIKLELLEEEIKTLKIDDTKKEKMVDTVLKIKDKILKLNRKQENIVEEINKLRPSLEQRKNYVLKQKEELDKKSNRITEIENIISKYNILQDEEDWEPEISTSIQAVIDKYFEEMRNLSYEQEKIIKEESLLEDLQVISQEAEDNDKSVQDKKEQEQRKKSSLTSEDFIKKISDFNMEMSKNEEKLSNSGKKTEVTTSENNGNQSLESNDNNRLKDNDLVIPNSPLTIEIPEERENTFFKEKNLGIYPKSYMLQSDSEIFSQVDTNTDMYKRKSELKGISDDLVGKWIIKNQDGVYESVANSENFDPDAVTLVLPDNAVIDTEDGTYSFELEEDLPEQEQLTEEDLKVEESHNNLFLEQKVKITKKLRAILGLSSLAAMTTSSVLEEQFLTKKVSNDIQRNEEIRNVKRLYRECRDLYERSKELNSSSYFETLEENLKKEFFTCANELKRKLNELDSKNLNSIEEVDSVQLDEYAIQLADVIDRVNQEIKIKKRNIRRR